MEGDDNTSFWDRGRARTGQAFFYALIVHLILGLSLLAVRQPEPDITPSDTVPVTLIFDALAPIAAPLEEKVTPPAPPKTAIKTPPQITEPPQSAKPEKNEAPPAEENEEETEEQEESNPAQSAPLPTSGPAIITNPPAASSLKPGSRWALNPPLSTDHLSGLGLLKDDVECLQSLSSDCTGLRKEVFAEFQMSETDKAWTPQYAHSGMPSEYFGLSEREIRQKLGLHLAGENGFSILPGIGIDGDLWDKLHGVKKGCEMKFGRASIMDGAEKILIKSCPKYQRGSKDRP